MLPKELALYTCSRGRAVPDRLTRKTHARYVSLADRLLTIFRNGCGKTREQLHRAAQAVFQTEPDCPPKRMRALIRLLDQAAEYETESAGRAFELRSKVFDLAARRHPLVTQRDALFEHAEREVKQAIAAELKLPWPDIERSLYSDLPEFHRLKKCDGYEQPEELLSRYNVAQAQTLLFWAEEMTILARADFKRILRHVKFHRLLHEAESAGPRQYRIRLTGPVSVLQQTRRYGVQMATMLPALLACRDWRMSARLRLPSGMAVFELSPGDGLKSLLPSAAEFDSTVEQDFAESFGVQRDGWTLEREGSVLMRGQKIFVPDFTFRRLDGTVMHLEIVGFWTPEYLEKKRQTFSLFADVPILIAVAASAKLPDPSHSVITYKKRLSVDVVMDRLAQFTPACERRHPPHEFRR